MLNEIKGKLIVSCQALEDEPLHHPMIMAKMALAAKMGGAVAIRSNSSEDIMAIKKEVNLPIIGLYKKNYSDSEVFITPTKKEVLALINSGCDMIALDATHRKRPNGEMLHHLVEFIHEHGRLAMADISTIDEAVAAEELGFDCVSTTLSGYTPYSPQQEEPDYELIKKCVEKLHVPVIAEGRISDANQLRTVLKQNPYAVVIGSAITRPQLITEKFVKVINEK
ncbi:MAG: N-acetylmannosamine-6-phosphate 2-epimerase [Tenericutes bacterium GWC2_34_14]|nr:MAG: N-acetylmannosamine-6-phosphate 2-epimerase [Tenericutes bacterium GWC2_34_14]OHE34818.1 MAG: N-acetylmannosamine-6-phosphate 2-epimerase [Tenericutes bacterium GWE2_34_108]OHE37321.1 MAG: N-acetylmannosamine-6-phosphate 2-epimerase [Tenericutes bacterium GWF1_35_14]OHE39546.1 MAG: N-acetylmannosamine-6-phosphate 2-epimerase [Tenericutes bacterium GWF2_35_184]OHE42185.1 MAG: N-acetylmannosamine-6-phosphate 2-epimerase [Tenericutes bacterium RIFOXYA12_FULL_35_10]OHE44265.1 MAG: N-acetyl